MSSETLESLELQVRDNPAVIVTDRKKEDDFYEHVKREVESFVPDLSTEAGRRAVASLAYKVTRTKTAIDEAGKRLNASLREQIDAVDESRRRIREKFDALRDQARRPLTEWEESEAKRKSHCAMILKEFADLSVVISGQTSAIVSMRLNRVQQIIVDPNLFLDSYDDALATRASTIATLKGAIARLEQEEADRAELARLRAEKERREAEEREAQRKAEEKRAAEEAAERRAQEEAQRAAAEKDRIEKAKREAEERAKRETEETARKEQERIQREHQDALDRERRDREEEKRKNDALIKKLQDEKDRLEADRVKAEQEQARKKLEAEKREADERRQAANKKHRMAIMTAAKVALMEHAGLEEEPARKVVLAISTEKIPNVSIKF